MLCTDVRTDSFKNAHVWDGFNRIAQYIALRDMCKLCVTFSSPSGYTLGSVTLAYCTGCVVLCAGCRVRGQIC